MVLDGLQRWPDSKGARAVARGFTFVHTADVHLDTPYRRHDDATRARLQDAGRQAFTRLIDLAIEVHADALLIAGDLFDNEWLTIATERLLVSELARVTAAGITVVYATGNHDPGRANYRAMHIEWPEERFQLVASRQPVTVPIDRSGKTVGWAAAAGHQTPRETENLAASFPPAPGPEPTVGLLHTNVSGASGFEDHDPYAPSEFADFQREDYGYWALGHIHGMNRVRDDLFAWYSGNLQGRNFGERGPKGALVVTLEAGVEPSVEFHPLAPVRWDVVSLNGLGDATGVTGIVDRAVAAFARLRGEDDVLPDQEWLLRVDLAGPSPLARTLRDPEAQSELAELLHDDLGVLDVDLRVHDLHPPVDVEAHRGQPHLLGQTLDLLASARSDNATLDAITPADLAGVDRADEGERRRHLRDLLDGLDTAAAEALLREPGA